MEPVSTLIFAAIIAVGATVTVAITYFSHKGEVKRNLIDQKKMSITNFKHGTVGKIVGNVYQHETLLTSPMSGRECVYYQIHVKEKKGKNSWATIIHEEKCVDFLVKDQSGTALVKTNNIKGYLVKDMKLSSGFLNDASPMMNSFLNRHRKSSVSFLGLNRSLKYFEGIIHVRESVAVKGKGEWEMKPDPSEQKLIITAGPDFELYVSDLSTTLK